MHMHMRKWRVVTLHYDLKIVVDAQNAIEILHKKESVNSECQKTHQKQQNEQLPLTSYHWLCRNIFCQIGFFFLFKYIEYIGGSSVLKKTI